MPEGYISPGANLKNKVSFAQTYAANRAAYGANHTFEWNGKKFITENREEQIQRTDKAAVDAGKYDNTVVAYTKYKFLDSLNSPDLNPADLTKGEMTKFVDTYANANALQRAAMLKGADQLTFKAIDQVLGETAKYNPTGEIPKAYSGPTTGSITAYNPDNEDVNTRLLDAVRTGSKVSNAALTIATGDVAGVATRSAQLLRDVLGYDNTTATAIQEFWDNSKDKALNKLSTDDQRVIAGGIASGLESTGAWLIGGPVGALISLGSIAANNSFEEGRTTWLDNNNKTYKTKEDAILMAGESNIRQLTIAENMQRTAIMTSLEIAGEAAGIPGMKLLMKGIPLTGSVGNIINSIKNSALGMVGEQGSEFLTTVAQMAVDNFSSFGLQQNASGEDWLNAIKDTALATAVSVGTAGSIATAKNNLLESKNYFRIPSGHFTPGFEDWFIKKNNPVLKKLGI